MFSEIINPFLNVRNKIKDSNGVWVDQVKPKETMRGLNEANVAVDSDTNIEVINTYGKKTIIDTFVIADTSNINIGMHLSDTGNAWDNNIATMLDFNPSGSLYRRGLSVDPIDKLGHDLFEIVNSNDEVQGKTIVLKRPFTFPDGCRINFYSGNYTRNGSLSYKIVWREVEE